MMIAARLDARSRRTARRFATTCGCYVCFAVLAWLLFSDRDVRDLGNVLQFACTAGAFLAIVRACRDGDRPNAASLTHWDEAMALNALSLGLHVLGRTLT